MNALDKIFKQEPKNGHANREKANIKSLKEAERTLEKAVREMNRTFDVMATKGMG